MKVISYRDSSTPATFRSRINWQQKQSFTCKIHFLTVCLCTFAKRKLQNRKSAKKREIEFSSFSEGAGCIREPTMFVELYFLKVQYWGKNRINSSHGGKK